METIQELLEHGKQCFENKEYPKAERYLRQVVKTNRYFADIHNMLGVIYHSEGKFEAAIVSFKEALKINPHYTEAKLNLTVLYNDLGLYQEAKALYGTLQKKQKGKSDNIEPVLRGKLSNMHADIGDVYRSIGLYKHAADEYAKALDFNPHYVDIRTKLGISLRENGDVTASVKELKQAIKDKPGYLSAGIQLGITYYSANKIKEAQKEWNTVLRKDPKNESAKLYLKLCNSKNT